jgi:cystathionine beta-lyase
MTELIYKNRKNTNSKKWDDQTGMYGEEGLHAMWIADMDFEVAGCVKEALHKYVDEGIYGYYKTPNEYYQSFINWELKHHGLLVKREWIRFSPGVISGFNWIIQFMTKKDDAIIVMTPVYYPFLEAVENNERKLVCSDLINNNGSYTIDFDDFEQKIIENGVKLFILCSPHNPVGRVWTKDELARVIQICRKHNVFIISDEIHQDLVYEKNKHTPSFVVDNYFENMISITAASKTFNLAGCKNSVVVIPDEDLRRKWDYYINGIRILNGNPFGYIAARAAYEGGESWLKEVNSQIYSNYKYLICRINSELPKAIVSPLEGTYMVWIDLKDYIKESDVSEIIQKKSRLAVDYGKWFGGERFNSFIRMNLATSQENVRIAINAMVKNLS